MATLVKRTVAPSGGDHTSLRDAVNWFKTNYPNFVTSDIYGEIEISGTWSSEDTHDIYMDTFTQDSTHYLHIYTSGDARHNGAWSDSAYRLHCPSTAISLASSCYIIVDGIQIESSTETRCVYISSGILILKNSLLKNTYTSGYTIIGSYGNFYGYNCAFVTVTGTGTNAQLYT